MRCHSEEVTYAARSGEVVGRADYLRGRLSSFQRRVQRALQLIDEAAHRGPIGVAFSGGKDSTVLLHLVRMVAPDAIACFYDDGAQLRQTYELIEATPNVWRYTVTPSLIEMCRLGNYWGHEGGDDAVSFDFGKKLIYEPARVAVRELGLAVMGLGLRAGESAGRHFNALRQGEMYWHERDQVWHLCPLQFWSADDIWTDVAVSGVAYNRAYDEMARLGLKREEMRVSCVLGADAVGFGRYAYLKQLDPPLWNRLCAEFPRLTAYV